MNTSLIHRALAVTAVVLLVLSFTGYVPEDFSLTVKLIASVMLALAVILRAVEKNREKKNNTTKKR
ncbi:MAG: hypothetical protein IJ382_05420 [Flavobacteriales bacterium]|nr:hypothetical protein [Flavobacteriales bacterium]